MPEPSRPNPASSANPWPLMLSLVGVDYFSTLAYLPSMAVEAAGPFAPIAAGAVVLVTFLLALPVYWYVVGRASDGRGATGVLEDLIKGWRGKDLTKEEADSFVVKKMIGAPCRISLVESGDFINIDSFSRCSKEEVASMPAMFNPAIYFSLDPEEFDRKIFDSLSDKTRDRIFLSPEYQALIGSRPQSEPVDTPFSPAGVPSTPAGNPAPAGSTAGGTPRTEAEAANQVNKDGSSYESDLPPF